jgi:hypothetical protein
MENIHSAWRRLWVVFRNDTPTVFLILAFATLRGAFSLVLPLGFQAWRSDFVSLRHRVSVVANQKGRHEHLGYLGCHK